MPASRLRTLTPLATRSPAATSTQPRRRYAGSLAATELTCCHARRPLRSSSRSPPLRALAGCHRACPGRRRARPCLCARLGSLPAPPRELACATAGHAALLIQATAGARLLPPCWSSARSPLTCDAALAYRPPRSLASATCTRLERSSGRSLAVSCVPAGVPAATHSHLQHRVGSLTCQPPPAFVATHDLGLATPFRFSGDPTN